MAKEIKDYLNFYLPFEFFFYTYPYKIIGFKDGGNFFHLWHEHGFFDVLKSDFKLPLRPLSDMTEEERAIWFEFDPGKTMRDCILFEALRTNYLRSKFIDVDGLIEAGLAIDKTKSLVNG